MQVDYSAAEQFLSYADGRTPLSEVWDHPAYDVARTHAAMLGMDLTPEDVSGAMANERTTFSNGERLDLRPREVDRLIEYVRSNESDWAELARHHLERITPDEDVSEVPVFLAVGYEFGVGHGDGAFVNLNEPLFHRYPRQLLYVAIHESSHVVYDWIHGFSEELGPELLESREGQRTAFDVLFHTEAYATFTPLELRRSEGSLGERDHTVCADYRVVTEEKRLPDLVEEYDALRDRLRSESIPPQELFENLFGGSRLPYRVGCAMLKRVAERRGIEAVREGFSLDPRSFQEEFDWVLDEYRDSN